MDCLELLTRYGHVDPADTPVLDAAATAIRNTADLDRASRRPSRRASRRRTTEPRRTLIGAASVAAAAAIAVAGVSLAAGRSTSPAPASHAAVGSRPSPTTTTAPATATTSAAAQPAGKTILARLASAVLASPAPPGDATLVVRYQVVNGGAPILGADLYTDSGQYYYAPSESGLPAQVNAGHNQGDGIFAREIAAAEQAATSSNLPGAAQAMEVAPDPTINPPSSSALSSNWLWENSLDALVAGSGNPSVRAGVMRLVATLPEVSVTDTTAQGVPAVQITATFPSMSKCGADPSATNAALKKFCADLVTSAYREQLTIDAATGIPISFAGGTPGQPPASQITYQVSRVTLSQVAQGHFVAAPTGAAGEA